LPITARSRIAAMIFTCTPPHLGQRRMSMSAASSAQ
jgi:hypothetical protein